MNAHNPTPGPLPDAEFAIINARAHAEPTAREHVELVNAAARRYAADHADAIAAEHAAHLAADRARFAELDVARLVEASADALSLLADMVLIASPDIPRSDIADVGAELETSLAPFTRMAETHSAAPKPITMGCVDSIGAFPNLSPNGVGK